MVGEQARNRFDVIVVGGGPAGAACAAAAARGGLAVALVERTPISQAARACIVDIERTAFSDTGIAGPTAREVAFAHHGTQVITPCGSHAFDLPALATHTLHLDRLVLRLREDAKTHGATLLGGLEVVSPLVEGARCIGLVARRRSNGLRELRARVVVDASGQEAVLTRRLPPACGLDFVDPPGDRVLAETRMYRLPREQAEALAAELELVPEQARMRLGHEGSYSTQVELVSPNQQLAFVLVGIKQDQPEAVARLDTRLSAWASRLPAEAEPLHEGRSSIRIRRAALRLVASGFAAVGEAAGMVLPIHGSGVASALRAGHALGAHLAAVLSQGGDGGVEQLWPWAAEFQRNRGALLATYDVQRRQVERLDPQLELEHFLLSGILQPEDMSRAMAAHPPRIKPTSLPRRLRGIVRHPRVALQLLGTVSRLLLVEAHWRRYPAQWNERAFRDWRRTAEHLLP